jgi:hypothetical protein
MEWAAWMNAAGGQQVAGVLPRRPAAGAALARAHLEYQGAHRAPGSEGPGWRNDLAVLRRVRDALASGGRR